MHADDQQLVYVVFLCCDAESAVQCPQKNQTDPGRASRGQRSTAAAGGQGVSNHAAEAAVHCHSLAVTAMPRDDLLM